jgi:hypothetical protein
VSQQLVALLAAARGLVFMYLTCLLRAYVAGCFVTCCCRACGGLTASPTASPGARPTCVRGATRC